MRILLASGPRLDAAVGGAKAALELAPEFERLGWEVELLSLAERLPGDRSRMRRARAEYLRDLVLTRGADFDVIDFDHQYLPFPRSEFPPATLLVARSVLLCHAVGARSFPRPRSARALAGGFVNGRARRASREEMLRFAHLSVEQADLVNVSNADDAALLTRIEIAPAKIAVFPFGLSERRRADFARLQPARGHRQLVAFVGTFDWRKGAADMPAIIAQVIREAPGAEFRLLGTRGMFSSSREVLARFPRRLRAQIEVVPSFAPAELPRLLEDCALGFFPSYLEGFGFGVLEMLAASLPVVAYDAPGVRMMLDGRLLVQAGDTNALAAEISGLLNDRARLLGARHEARQRAAHFRWREIAEATAELYRERLVQLRDGSRPLAPAEARTRLEASSGVKR